MKRITRNKRKWKKKVSERRKAAKEMVAMGEINDTDVKVEFIQALIPLGLKAVGDMLQKEIEMLAGLKHKHGKINTRWGSQNGSVYLRDQKIPIDVPRVRNKAGDTEIPLTSYQKLQQPYKEDEQTFKKLLNGISTHKYQESAELMPEVFGLSASNMSQRFKKTTTAKLRNLQIRSLRRYDFVSIFIDGKRFAEDGIVIAVGITIKGEKVILGIEQMATDLPAGRQGITGQ